MITYNPFSGLFYACASKDKNKLLRWLNGNNSEPPSPIYKKTLGVGWDIAIKDAEYPTPHLLPSPNEWATVPPANMPILINWLITGNCPLACKYCYAQDVMHGKYPEPDIKSINNIADKILSYDPLVVVLTGGDPIVSPHLERAIKLLRNKVGIIVDTCGYSLKQEQIEMFRDYGVLIRISLDSEIPRINRFLRPVSTEFKTSNGGPFADSAKAALNAIVECVDNDVKVTVHSVATKNNQSDFEAFGNKLFKLGVRGWRILLVSPCKANIKMYNKLIGDKTSQKRFYSRIVEQIMSKQRNTWYEGMSVQIINNAIPNDVILVAPDGTYLTESNLTKQNSGKVIIDLEAPKNPKIECIRTHVDMNAHTARYLYLHD